jgi:hypothetical protein
MTNICSKHRKTAEIPTNKFRLKKTNFVGRQSKIRLKLYIKLDHSVVKGLAIVWVNISACHEDEDVGSRFVQKSTYLYT